MDNSKYVYKNGKRLRTGYTTGSCAAAAAKAAANMLISQSIIELVEIDTPKGWRLKLDVHEPMIEKNYVSCCIIKDSGDDPDITDGVKVYAKAEMLPYADIVITTGKGIGIVTRAGLQVMQGKPAINPVPMKMIKKEVSEVLPEAMGVKIELSIPAGEELAKRTFNPKLGIIGGLSVLGTSGIVEPMSEAAIMDTIAIELSCYRSSGNEGVVLVPGNYGEDFCKRWLNVSGNKIIKVSNYLGFALEKCSELGFKRLIVAGHIGKLIKTAGGIFYTHSRTSDTRMEILTANLAVIGADILMLKQIMECRTTEEAMAIINNSSYTTVYEVIAEKSALRCEDYIFNAIEAGVFVFSMDRLIARSKRADKILGEILNE